MMAMTPAKANANMDANKPARTKPDLLQQSDRGAMGTSRRLVGALISATFHLSPRSSSLTCLLFSARLKWCGTLSLTKQYCKSIRPRNSALATIGSVVRLAQVQKPGSGGRKARGRGSFGGSAHAAVDGTLTIRPWR